MGNKHTPTHLRVADWCAHSGADRLHHGALLGWQQVVLHGLNQVVLTSAAVLHQSLLLHPLHNRTYSYTIRHVSMQVYRHVLSRLIWRSISVSYKNIIAFTFSYNYILLSVVAHIYTHIYLF